MKYQCLRVPKEFLILVIKKELPYEHLTNTANELSFLFFKKFDLELIPAAFGEVTSVGGKKVKHNLLCSLCQPYQLVEFKLIPVLVVNYGT